MKSGRKPAPGVHNDPGWLWLQACLQVLALRPHCINDPGMLIDGLGNRNTFTECKEKRCVVEDKSSRTGLI